MTRRAFIIGPLGHNVESYRNKRFNFVLVDALCFTKMGITDGDYAV